MLHKLLRPHDFTLHYFNTYLNYILYLNYALKSWYIIFSLNVKSNIIIA